MKIKNTPSRRKFILFAGAIIDVPVKANWLGINEYGIVFATEYAPVVTDLGQVVTDRLDSIEESADAVLVACVEGHGVAQVIKIEDLMAGIA